MKVRPDDSRANQGYSDRIEEIVLAEQGELTEGEKALLELLVKKLRRELEKAA